MDTKLLVVQEDTRAFAVKSDAQTVIIAPACAVYVLTMNVLMLRVTSTYCLKIRF